MNKRDTLRSTQANTNIRFYKILKGNDHEVEFHEIKIQLFHEIEITIMRLKLDLIMRSKLGLNI